MQIMYGIDGRRDLTESTRDDLTGYAGARPVRIGNGAFDQRQNDVFGAVLDSILLHTRRSERCHAPLADRPVAGGVRHQVWREPDQGIWEARGEPQHYVSSKMMSGSRWTARAPNWPGSEPTRQSRPRGAPPPTRFATTSSSTE